MVGGWLWGMRKWLSRLGNRRRGSGGLRSAGDGARGLTVVMMGCGVSLEGNWGGEIDAFVTSKLATASGHIAFQALAMRAVWTGGRPEDWGSYPAVVTAPCTLLRPRRQWCGPFRPRLAVSPAD